MALTIYGLGNLGRDPETRVLDDGRSVTNISVCFNDRYTPAGGEVIESKIWVRFSIWGKSGEVVAQYFNAGSPIFVKSAKLLGDENGNPRIFTRTDGTQGTSYEGFLREWEFAGKNGGSTPETDTPAGTSTQDDEIPF